MSDSTPPLVGKHGNGNSAGKPLDRGFGRDTLASMSDSVVATGLHAESGQTLSSEHSDVKTAESEALSLQRTKALAREEEEA